MTPLETLQKYGLKTDVKSIKERMRIDVYPQLVPLAPRCYDDNDGSRTTMLEKAREAEIDMLRAADLELLFELAEKGERAESAEKELAEIKGRAEARRTRYEESLGCLLDETDMTKEIDFIIKGEGK